jgi:hypothetical protein
MAIKMLEDSHDFSGQPSENVAVYRSGFLKNGMLMYFPVAPHDISQGYAQGVLNRIVWEFLLGVGNDAVLKRMLFEAVNGNGMGRNVKKYSAAIDTYQGLTTQGMASAKEIIAKCTKSPINHNQILRNADALNRIESAILKTEMLPGILCHFHLFEMMDMDDAQFPDLAWEYLKKYKKMTQFADYHAYVFDAVLKHMAFPSDDG